jgi:hypothetical protein
VEGFPCTELLRCTPPVAFGCELEGWGVVDRLEACGVVRPSDLEAPLAAGGSSRSPGQLEASPW